MNETNRFLSNHATPMVLSYLGIRRAVGGLGMLLPVVLGLGGWLFFGVEIQENLSSYYHTPLRDIFVGVMCAIGLFLYCYRGHSHFEDWTGNVGCLAAVGIAIFPLDAGSDPLMQSTIAGYLHTVCGGLFFFVLAIFSIYHFPINEPEDDFPDFLLGKSTLFRLSGIVILVSELLMGIYLILLPTEFRETLTEINFLFWMESVAVWAFAGAWLIKGRALAILVEGIEVVKSFKSSP